MIISIQIEGDNLTSEEIFEKLQSITGQDCLRLANLNPDEQYIINDTIIAYRVF